MSILIPDRVLQTTTTAGTGTYQLIAPSAAFRPFSAVYVSGAVVPYCTSDNQFGFEIGVGIFNSGTPDTITRSSIILSSNFNAAVSWSGTTKQIFAWDTSTSAYASLFSGDITVGLQDWGSSFIFTGSTVHTFTLPLLSTVPRGYSVRLKNSGTAVCNVTPQNTNAIETLAVATPYAHNPGWFATYTSDFTVWRQTEIGSATPGATAALTHRVTAGSSDTLSTLTALRTQITWESNSGVAKSQVIPDPTTVDGYDIDIIDIFGDSSSNPITITPSGTGTITAAGVGPQSSIGLASPYGNLTLRAIAALNTWIVR